MVKATSIAGVHIDVHELMLAATGSSGPVRASLALGRGFAPFGTDDSRA